MIFHYAGKYNGDENSLPHREHPPDATKFKETGDMKMLSLAANGGCMITIVLLTIPFIMLGKDYVSDHKMLLGLSLIAAMMSLLPHEFLHALCYKKDVYMYEDLKQGMLFVAGCEDMSKRRFIFMCMLPNLVFGIIPYVIFLIYPKLTFLGLFGLTCTGMGFGDYINVFNALTQMPKGSVTYLSGMHSYWYIPEKDERRKQNEKVQ